MADIKRVIPKGRREKTSKYASHSGDVYEMKLGSEDNAFSPVIIWADNPTASNFNEAPIGSWLYDISSAGKIYYKSAATTWKTITTS
jgi:hypothetical protein